MSSEPLILITNDDGFWAPGIQALAAGMRKVARVLIVAPHLEQSAKGHGITMNDPIRFQEQYQDGKLLGYSVFGTPADCVKVATRYLMDEEPDVIYSGINHGRNTGMNVLYSGTVAGAMEGAMYNHPSVAFSLASGKPDADFSVAVMVAQQLLPRLRSLGLPHGVMLNVNVPAIPADQIKGVVVASQSQFRFLDVFDERHDPRGQMYFWLSGERMPVTETGSIDEIAVNDGKIAITPLKADMTDYDWMERLEALDFTAMLNVDGDKSDGE